jgi:hypothetical protein
MTACPDDEADADPAGDATYANADVPNTPAAAAAPAPALSTCRRDTGATDMRFLLGVL